MDAESRIHCDIAFGTYDDTDPTYVTFNLFSDYYYYYFCTYHLASTFKENFVCKKIDIFGYNYYYNSPAQADNFRVSLSRI